MFHHAVLSLTRQLTQGAYDKSALMDIVGDALDVASMVTVIVVRLDQSNTASARTTNENIRTNANLLRAMGTVNVLIYDGSIRSLVEKGVRASVYFGDDLAVALADRAGVPSRFEGVLTHRHSASRRFTSSAVSRLAKYVTEYDNRDRVSIPPLVSDDRHLAVADAARAAGSTQPYGGTGRCALFVRRALAKGGFPAAEVPSFGGPTQHGYHYADPNSVAGKALHKMGYRIITPPSNSGFMKGDILSYPRHPSNGTANGRKYGHVQVFDGLNWISDFIQKTPYPWRTNAPPTVWRRSRGSIADVAKPKVNSSVLGFVLGQNSLEEEDDLKLSDIHKPDGDSVKRFLAKYNSRSMSVDAFRQMFTEAGRLFRVPASIMTMIAELENSFPNKPDLLHSAAYETSTSFTGPWQHGAPNWSDTVGIASKYYGIRLTPVKTLATLGELTVGMLMYLRFNAQTYDKIGAQPMDDVSVYMVHNQGPGGFLSLIKGQVPGWLKINLKPQSRRVKGIIRDRYRIVI